MSAWFTIPGLGAVVLDQQRPPTRAELRRALEVRLIKRATAEAIPHRAYRIAALSEAAGCSAEGDRRGVQLALRDAVFWRRYEARQAMAPANDMEANHG